MKPEFSHEEHEQKVASLRLSNGSGTEDWGPISKCGDKPCTKKIANEFLLCCLLDYQIKAQRAGEKGHRLVLDILKDPEDLWIKITSFSKEEWKSKFNEYHLHRYPAAHHRLWRIGNKICAQYAGDARVIWEGKKADEVLCRLLEIGAGNQISRMIVGALRDCGQITGSGNVKADSHIWRVLGRVFSGSPINGEAATERARQLYPNDPWRLDWPLWTVGNSLCTSNGPKCPSCYLSPQCSYAFEHLSHS